MPQPPTPLEDLQLYAWVGEDELGSGQLDIKQARVPAGVIPIVGIDRKKMERVWPQMESQARHWGKRIRLCRFILVEVIRETRAGK